MAAGDPGSVKRNFSSTAVETSLVSSIAAQAQGTSNTAFIVASNSGFPSVPFTLIVDPDTSKEEVVTVTAASSTTLTVTRGEDSTQGVAHSAGAVVRHGVSGRDFREEQTHIAARGYDADQAILDLANQTHVHGLASGDGSVVGTTKAQTLTNKTLTSPVITGGQVGDNGITFEGATADTHETFLAVTDPTADRTITLPDATGNVVLDTLAQTLTNKTLTSPTISGSPVITGLSSAGMVASSATPKDYVDAILGSATAAATSATSAATSATSAATSATSASNSATASASSASASASSASAAATSATSAASSATAAATSASSASTSATSAAADAATAAASVATISGYATTASNSAAAASTSATSSATSASAAATSASSAATSATAAATSATSAAASATAAATSATSASVSAASAAAAVTTAIQASIIDAKGDLIVGTAADTAGRLAVGTNGHILTADSAETTGIKWSAAPAGFTAPTIGTTVITSGTTVSTIESVTLNNATLTGTLTAGATSGINGYLLTATTSGVTWAAAPVSLPSQTGNTGKLLVTDGTTASWAGAAPIASPTEPTTLIDGLVWVDTDGSVPGQAVVRWSKAPTGGTTSLSGLDDSSVTLSYTAGYEQVYRNGVLLSRGNDYTATSGNSITLIDATLTGDIIEVIGSSVLAIADVYTQAQANSNYIGKALTTTTGDIIYASAANTPARLGIGSSAQVLTVASGVPSWATPSSGGMTLISTTNLTGTSVTLSSIPQTYKNLQLVLRDFYPANSGVSLFVRINADTGANYQVIKARSSASSNANATAQTLISLNDNSNDSWNSDVNNHGVFNFYDYTQAFRQVFNCLFIYDDSSGPTPVTVGITGAYLPSTSAAITSLVIGAVSGNFGGGTALLYGVS